MLDSPESTRFPASCRSSVGCRPPEGCPIPEGLADAPRAFARLYQRYVGFTWRVVGQAGVPNHAIDDVVQEVWLIVHRRLPSFEGRSAVKSWLFGVSLNVARNQRRSDRRRQKHLPEPLGEGNSLDPERIRAGREACEQVERFLCGLDDRRRTIFAHQFIENRSARETADAIGVDVITVYRQVRLLRAGLGRWLAREFDGNVERRTRSRAIAARA